MVPSFWLNTSLDVALKVIFRCDYYLYHNSHRFQTCQYPQPCESIPKNQPLSIYILKNTHPTDCFSENPNTIWLYTVTCENFLCIIGLALKKNRMYIISTYLTFIHSHNVFGIKTNNLKFLFKKKPWYDFWSWNWGFRIIFLQKSQELKKPQTPYQNTNTLSFNR